MCVGAPVARRSWFSSLEVCVRVCVKARWLVLLPFVLVAPRSALAQGQGGTPVPVPTGHEHHVMATPVNPLGVDHVRDGSGTSWLPDASPMQGQMRRRGTWMLMLHGNAFVQYI